VEGGKKTKPPGTGTRGHGDAVNELEGASGRVGEGEKEAWERGCLGAWEKKRVTQNAYCRTQGGEENETA